VCSSDLDFTVSQRLYINAFLATMDQNSDPYGLVENGALAAVGGEITWCGRHDEVPDEYANFQSEDLGGRLITPGLVDCHSHIVFGGDRAREFEMRLEGASYEEVARAGGGIVSTVKATRLAEESDLLVGALARVDALISEGVTTIEIKSGYGLDLETELKMLRVARAVERSRPIRVKTSFLGAHAIPPEFSGQPDEYIDEVCIPALRAAHQAALVDAVDGFCENIAFTLVQIERVFKVAKDLGLPVKLHAEQLSSLGGASLAARYDALSADHLEYLDEAGVMDMKNAATIAVILPGAYYTLRETRAPPVELFRKHQVPMAVATDGNPGSSPMFSVLLAMNMASTLFGLTPAEALAGVTTNAAKALGIVDIGILSAGMRADLAIWNVGHPAELAYRIGFNSLHKRVFGGV